MASRSLLAAALKYAARGWHVIPLEVGGKRPFFNLLPLRDPAKPKSKTNTAVFTPFMETAATPEQIKKWWTKAPDANIGLICNHESGLLVVDIDTNKKDENGNHVADPEHLENLRTRNGFDETPLIVQTTSGGWHMYYRHPRKGTPVVSQKKHIKAPCVDVQARGYYVVAPPSIRNRTRYKWFEDASYDAELPPPPAWVIAPESAGHRVYNDIWLAEALTTDTRAGSADGSPGRTRKVRSLSQAFCKRGLPMDIAEAIIWNHNLQHLKPSLSDVAIHRNVYHMYEKVAQDRMADGSDGITLRYNGRPFPFDALRESAPRIYKWVQTVTDEKSVHPDMVACAGLLGLASAASYCRIEIEGVNHWKPPAHLWGTIVYESGGKKTAVFELIMNALEPTGEALAATAEIFNNAVEIDREVLEARKRSLRTKLNKSASSEILAELRDTNLELSRVPINLPLSWTTSDATPEALLIKIAALGWAGLFSDEGADLLKGLFGHYSGRSDISGILKGYDLGSTEQDRVGRGYLKVKNTRVSWLMATQPIVLAGLNGTEAEDRGFLARMQFCVPNDNAWTKLPQCTEQPAGVLKDFDAMMLGVYYGGDIDKHNAAFHYKPEYTGCTFDDDEEIGAPMQAGLQRPVCRDEYTMHVSADVWAILSTFQSEMAEAARSGGKHRRAKSWCKKAGEHALRMAVVIELAESNGKARELTIERAEVGIELMREYFLYQYYAAVDRMSCPRIADDGIHVLQRFLERESFTTADLAKDMHITTEAAAELVRWLADRQTLTFKGRGRNLECKVLPGVDY